MSKLATIILAGGKSTRLKSQTSKILHPVAGRPIVSYPLNAAFGLKSRPVCLVLGRNQRKLTSNFIGWPVKLAYQSQPLGTAHAVLAAKRVLASFSGLVVILPGDLPLITANTLKNFVALVKKRRTVLGVLTMNLKDPGRYGRIVRDLDGRVLKIVEADDASSEELKIGEVNSGIFCADKNWLFKTLSKVSSHNAQKEYYLPDIVGQATASGHEVAAYTGPDQLEFLGVNTRADLDLAAKIKRQRINAGHQVAGVGVLDSANTHIDADARIGEDSVIWPYTFILGRTRIGRNCVIENGVVLKDAMVGNGAHIKAYSVVEQSVIGASAVLGPFARIRPQSKIGRGARVGNFVEVKKSVLAEGVKANHLTYLGDAKIGAGTNIGCGTITCNYDGVAKHLTKIGREVFVGSDVQFVAPVKIGNGATIGAGSTITDNVPPKTLALARARQVVIKGWKRKEKR